MRAEAGKMTQEHLEALTAELRATMGKLELALSAVDDAIAWTDDRGNIQWCNGRFNALIERPHIDILGKSIFAVLPLEKDGARLSLEAHPVELARKDRTRIADFCELTTDKRALSLVIQAAWMDVNGRSPILVLTLRTISERLLAGAAPAAHERRPVTGRFEIPDALRGWRKPALLAGLALFYLVAAKLGLRFASIHPSATPVWAPTGIALAALLVWGRKVWPGVFAGAFLANILTAGTVATSLGIAAGNTLEGLLGAWLTARWAGGGKCFEEPRNIFKFAVLAGLSSAVSAAVGVTSLCLGGFAPWSRFGAVAATWWFGDLTGALVVAPPLLIWAAAPGPACKPARGAEFLLLVLLPLLAGQIIFGPLLAGLGHLPISYLAIPALVWAALRFGQRETGAASLLLAGSAIWGTLNGYGPFARGALNENLLLLQMFLAVSSLLALSVAAMVADGRRAHEQIKNSHDELERRIGQRTAALERANASMRVEIEERKKAEENTRLYTDVVKNAQIGLVVLRQESPSDVRSFRILAANPAASKAAGFPINRFEGKTLAESFPRLFETGLPRSWAEVVRTGESRDLGEIRYGDDNVPSGTFLVKAFPLPGGCVGVAFENITERKRIESQLLESRERFRLFIDNVKDYAIFLLDADGRVASWNQGAERIHGYGAEEVIGKPLSCFYTPEDVQDGKPQRLLLAAAVEGRAEDEGWRSRKDGTRFWASAVLTAFKDASGRLKGFVKVTRDVTERRDAEDMLKLKTEELGRSNAELNLFASIVAHELQEPLRKIVAFGDLLKTGVSKEDAAAYRAKMTDAAERMQRLVDDMLALSRVTSQAQALESADLDGILREIAADFKDRLAAAGGSLEVGPLPALYGDPNQLRQLFTNLISNAFKFRRKEEPARIEVRAGAPKKGFVTIAVTDNGIGFEEEHRERIFRPFQRLHRRTEYEGSGMGLAICDRILLRHGGTISAKSEPGKGSTFLVTLPAAGGGPDAKA